MKTLICIALFLSLLVPKTYAISPEPPKGQNVAPSPVFSQESAIPSSTVRAYVEQQAEIAGINVTDVLWILDHESQDGQNLYGDDNQSLGPWMISTVWHPEVGRECSLSLQCSTSWSENWIKKGNISQWSTWSCRYAWFYQDAVMTFGLPPTGYKEPHQCKKK